MPQSRGLDLSNLNTVTREEKEAFTSFYDTTIGHRLQGLEFWFDEGPATLKRYRAFSDAATPKNYESERRLFVFGFLPFYAVIGFHEGIRYLINTRQNMGMTKEQILDGIAISFLVMGPAGMEQVAQALETYDWIEPPRPARFPDGWSIDAGALASGLDFSSETMTATEITALKKWYKDTLGEVPRHVDFLAQHRPNLLKAYRHRFETCMSHVPVQFLPTTLLHYNVIRGFRDGIREDLLLARALGVSKEIVLNTIGSALLNGMEALNVVDEAANDVFANWDD